MSLTAGQLAALHNLARKQGGQTVDWISISHARALAELGLAARTGDGWRITPAGNAALAELSPAEPPRGLGAAALDPDPTTQDLDP